MQTMWDIDDAMDERQTKPAKGQHNRKSFFPFCAVFQKQYMLKKATTPGPQSYSMPHRWASSWTNTQ